jgi:hypothetical protein
MQHDYHWKGSRTRRDEDSRCPDETGRLLPSAPLGGRLRFR